MIQQESNSQPSQNHWCKSTEQTIPAATGRGYPSTSTRAECTLQPDIHQGAPCTRGHPAPGGTTAPGGTLHHCTRGGTLHHCPARQPTEGTTNGPSRSCTASYMQRALPGCKPTQAGTYKHVHRQVQPSAYRGCAAIRWPLHCLCLCVHVLAPVLLRPLCCLCLRTQGAVCLRTPRCCACAHIAGTHPKVRCQAPLTPHLDHILYRSSLCQQPDQLAQQGPHGPGIFRKHVCHGHLAQGVQLRSCLQAMHTGWKGAQTNSTQVRAPKHGASCKHARVVAHVHRQMHTE